jgi:hypothetical protein
METKMIAVMAVMLAGIEILLVSIAITNWNVWWLPFAPFAAFTVVVGAIWMMELTFKLVAWPFRGYFNKPEVIEPVVVDTPYPEGWEYVDTSTN